ncbi:MAG TPA: bifunctional serine/threonine-protein kinase/formylglycine-generating enzyme family protein, partial [Lacipirellulaceae bacterium]|nr:bifunctional serine/threonine-protein kinase/formylglycine-generating enzyme family protein [Lacipirellulaceae bacterium]
MNQHPAYELFEELGRGSNSVVYRSYDLSLGREVAIKELDESSRRDPRQRERFLREAQFLAQFEHDNVLRVYSVDTERGWIIMELMKGTLASLIAAGPSNPDLVRSILKQTLDALVFLHEKNKVHGTVRPTNLLINEAGRVKLSEFEQTDIGGELRAPKGSKKYLAPELIRPEFGEFGPPLDLYCLGFTALELLKGPQFDSLFPGTGKGAIDADMAWLRWHSSPEELASTHKLVKGIPDDLAHVLDHMLKKHVADRPQSVQEVISELVDRPLIAVPVAGAETEEGDAAEQGPAGAAVVRTLATPQMLTPRGANPVASAGDLAKPRSAAAAKSAGAAKSSNPTTAKPAPARFSKDWFNQELGRPYVLYPLCAAMIIGALWFVFGGSSGGSASIGAASKGDAAKQAVPAIIPVKFDITPDSKGLEVAEGNVKIAPAIDGSYGFPPGRHAVVFRKEGFQPLTHEFDISPEHKTFAVKLEPVVKFVDVTIQVTPATAQLKTGGVTRSLTNGAYTEKVEQGKPLAVEASLDGFVTISRTISVDELKTRGNKVMLKLEREKPHLPATLVAKPGAAIDPVLQVPVRVLAARLGDKEPMELVLVQPGTYNFGAPPARRRRNELPQRSVRIEQPFYIALTETTNAQYDHFFEAEGTAKAGDRWQKASQKWAKPLHLDPIKNHLPVTNVSTDEARAFCTWVGGELPAEIQWESAVRGLHDDGFPYPWGSAPPGRDRCRIFYGEKLELGEGGPVPVEQLAAGASPLGLLHAIGNAAEICKDSEHPDQFVVRGCSITTANIDDVRVTWRGHCDPRGEESNGFRVIFPITVKSPNGAVNYEPGSGRHSAPDSASVSLTTPLGFLVSIPWKTVAIA